MYVYNSNHFNTKLLGICFKNARFRELSLTLFHMTAGSFSLSLPLSPFPFLPHSQCEAEYFTLPNVSIRSCLSELGTNSTGIKLYCWLTGLGFPGGSVVKNPPAKARDTRNVGSIPGSGRSPGEGKGYPLQYSGLENSIDYSPWGCKELDMTKQPNLPLEKSVYRPGSNS